LLVVLVVAVVPGTIIILAGQVDAGGERKTAGD
jgi:hypothetical protein